MQYVYKIINKRNNKFYIGRTKRLKSRIKSHFKSLENNNHHSKYLQNAFNNETDKSVFIVEIVESFDTGDDDIDLKLAKELEQYYLDTFNLGEEIYNVSHSSETGVLKGKDHHRYGKTFKDVLGEEKYKEMLDKVSIALKGEKNPFYGKTHSKELIDHFRYSGVCALPGEKNPFYGKKHSEETKKLISEKVKLGHKNSKKARTGKPKPLYVNGVYYPSMKQAAIGLGLTRRQFEKLIDRNEIEYKFVTNDESSTTIENTRESGSE